MKLLGKSAPEKVVSKAEHADMKTMVTSGVTALAVMGAVTAASAVVSSLRVKGEERVMLRAALLFGAGYVLGAKAGKERYAEIEELAKKVTERFAEHGSPPTSASHRT